MKLFRQHTNSLSNQDSIFSCVILYLKQISKQSVISLILFNQYMEWSIQNRLTLNTGHNIDIISANQNNFVSGKAILSGISVFTLIKQCYINKTAFPWNLSIPCIIPYIVPFHVLVTSIYIGTLDRFLAHYQFIWYGYRSVYQPPIWYILIYRYTLAATYSFLHS